MRQDFDPDKGRRTDEAHADDTAPDSLVHLHAFDELRIGPARLEKRRLSAAYTIVQGDQRDTIDLVYSYEEDVFEPGNAVDQNLADMIAAQLALNYGLFSTRIVFEGSFDSADRRLLRDMAENTAREIYVNKFLEPNPFLVGPVSELSPAKLDRFCLAELVFTRINQKVDIGWSPMESNRTRIAVLSSGGKDSLLSYGLLNELGYEVHPIFGNESGRHWFTALNAYRHFEANVPNTAKVWMNTDRIFSWMLRHIPFVRKDFENVRADIYPIRLWTVALFLFGALPLARRKNAGRIVIGDEYDTTVRTSKFGITHYSGLFDQSRYFDVYMSRFFARKRWRLSQFSFIRQMSELLIERVLVARYPKLFENQVSCHAAHIDGQRVRPCGKCEKCRRIVGMVVANGGSPTACGYTEDQIKSCLDSIIKQGVHQERPAAEHLIWLLAKNGEIHLRSGQKTNERPEVMKLRFDPVRSPLDGIPHDLRVPLFRILLEHADGAVRRSGRMWVDFDPLTDVSLHRPYLFERTRPRREPSGARASRAETFMLGEMTWPEARRRFSEVDVALLPVGAIEQHGPHLPLDTDAFDANYLAKLVASRCSDPKPVVLPLVPYGVSYHHNEFSGTISIRNETLANMVFEIGMEASRNGVTKLVIINGHGGNDPALNFAAQEINRSAHIFVCVDSGETSDVDVYSMIDTPNDVHAGEIETSTSLATRPELVQMVKAKPVIPEFSSRYLDFTSKRGITWYAFTKKISESGVMGDPTKATAEKGKKMWEVMSRHLVEFIEELKRLTLDEIFQKRY